jgi:integrase
VRDYLNHKAGGISPATLHAYDGYLRQIVATLGDPTLAELPRLLPTWIHDEVDRLFGRRNTVVKRMEAIIKPAIRHAYAQHGLGVPFVFPELRSDYKAAGVRQGYFSREEFAALRAELPESALLESAVGKPSFACYPRVWCDLAVTTGLHASDLDAFTASDYDVAAHTWRRDNSKNAQHYRPEWLRAPAYMHERISVHLARYELRGADLLVAAEAPPPQWMRRRLIWAAKRAGLPWTPAPIDFRRTCAQWMRADGWTFEETAKWLGNSSGIVAQVYAPTPARDIDRAVARGARASHKLIALTRDLEGVRKSPRKAFGQSVVHSSNPGSKPTKRKALTHGKQTVQGGAPTD